MNKKNQMVNFRIGAEQFGVPVSMVQEIVRLPQITPVPEMPPFVEGIINLRGRIITIINLSRRMGIEGSARSKTSRILIVEIENRIIGLLVDAVLEIIRIPDDRIEPAPDTITGVGAQYIIGVGKLPDRLIIVLDLSGLLKPDEMHALHAQENGVHGRKEDNGAPPLAA